jgi:hypothetical protein
LRCAPANIVSNFCVKKFGTSPLLGAPPTCLDEDLQPGILEIVEPVRPPLDGVDLDVESFARGIGQPVLGVAHDPVEIGRDGLS